MDELMVWLLERGGLSAGVYRATALQRRLPACLRQLRVSSPDTARELLERKPHLLPFALSSILIGVSEFFRDRPVFDQLRDTVLPELQATRAKLRVCSAGCSGGQELYSLAMLLAESGGLETSELRGVDCRADAIEHARAGRFTSEDLAGVDLSRRERFFQPAGGGQWVARPELKNRLTWQTADLLEFDPDGPCDLILFRNVAIYFNDEHGAAAWSRLCGRLSPGGFVVTGRAERPPAALPLTRVAPSIYRKNQS